ncbi:M14 family metallopeptidase [Aliiglaciecola sp. CAU 1673]|uniref:M14 metallopeptidase family protein n=1 Tax=Aliiglaciecola sp. CAU 1673 TaxID=3032595 RepID=UPI0023DCCE66|nr:M14 metallopeptidase family protein [Aliiglaciecola sp. CAU 1673]MDF2179246.1 M14 family metallopeptidase [Aliiglaciecola sp. CAU 1673]
MKLWHQLVIFCLFCSMLAQGQPSKASDYLPKGLTFDATVPTPESVLGYPVGQWHVRHDQLVHYMTLLAKSSPRVSIDEIGRTHEQRPLLMLKFTSKANQQRLDGLKEKHLQGLVEGDVEDAPLVIWLGYSVHGDEPSGANASMLVAYYLAAAQGKEVEALLEKAIVLIDPSLNPDGLSRFAQWANMHKGQNLVADKVHREHVQAWPGARTNHYWFDLNRDWLLLTHPESRARIAQFHQWRPNVMADFHEMGTDSTYFFQPGVPSRKNPWTPDANVTLTNSLAKFHAAAFDKTGQLYFTEEGFDDFYYGKGSTYPDALGSVGILFEQASSRGHLQDSVHGPLAFPDTVQNQVLTSLSTLEGALENASALKRYQQEFAQDTLKLAREDEVAGYLLTEAEDMSRMRALLAILKQHQIEIKGLSKDMEREGKTFLAQNSIFIPLEQPNYRLIKSIFSTRTSFEDNTFYDVSNWNLPLAFNIDYAPVERRFWRKLPLTDTVPGFMQTPLTLQQNAYAYVFSWQDSQAPRLLKALLDEGVQAKIASTGFSAQTTQGNVSLKPGAIILPKGLKQPGDWVEIIDRQARTLGIPVWSVVTGLTEQGSDLGSRKMLMAKAPKVLLVGGESTSQYELGEVWHALDLRLGIAASLVEVERLAKIDLSQYSHVIMVDGNYKSISEQISKSLEQWINAGGVLIAQKRAAKFAADKDWLKANFLSKEDINSAFDFNNLIYADKENLKSRQDVAGAVFEAELDLSHPLFFGYREPTLSYLRDSNLIMRMPNRPFVAPSRYTRAPLKAGYASEEIQRLIASSANVVAHNVGKGKVIAVVDNLNFRGYWYGTSRVLSNALYLASFIDAEG